MTLVGKYVQTFAEATHALPQEMHMNADYPFMLPKIQEKTVTSITIVGRRQETARLAIEVDEDGDEFAYIVQSSAYERMFRCEPTRFKLLPFKEETSR